MIKKKWPYPGDSPVVRARKVALAYRHVAGEWENIISELRDRFGTDVIDHIFDQHPHQQNVEILDKLFTHWGETWHCPRPDHYDDDDYVDAKTAGELIQLAPGTIYRHRVRGNIEGVWDPDRGHRGAFLFRVADLHKLQSEIRSRPQGRRKGTLFAGAANATTDNITDDRSSDRE